ncbi:MAG: tetratricopeptide repeat protein, partial [Gaiellales bacterium]
MSAHDGMIGIPIGHADPGAMPQLNGYGHGAAAGMGAAQQQPQTWAFPTPQGMQLVYPGAGQQLVPGTAPYGAGAGAATALAIPAARRHRLRWETIIPGAAIVLFLAAVALFISDFDRITGRDARGDAAKVTAAAAAATPSVAGPAAASSEVLNEAQALFAAGQFEDAANLLFPLLDTTAPDAKATALNDKIEAAATKNARLLKQATKQRKAGAWSELAATIGSLEQLRPLTPSLTKLRATATRNARIDTALARAGALAKQGRTAEAMTVINKALKAGPNRRLSALRSKLKAASARPSKAAGVAGGGARSERGTAAAPTSPPVAGGSRPTKAPNATPAIKPPANVPGGSLPKLPSVPNPVASAGGGAAAVAGASAGAGAEENCHMHDGVRMCV